jgi:hypothetical protein
MIPRRSFLGLLALGVSVLRAPRHRRAILRGGWVLLDNDT